MKNRLSRFEENDKDRQRNGYEFESGLRYLKEDIRFTKQEPMFEMVLQRSLYSDMGEQLLAEQETYSDHKVTRGYVYFGNQRVGVVERREALAAAQSATQEGSRGSSPGGIERATALSNHEGSRGSSPGFPDGKDRWTSYVRDHQGTLLMSLAEYEAQAAGWGMTDPRYMDAAGKSRLETTAKIGANQYYVYPYGVLPHKGFLYAQLQAAEYTGKNLDEGTQWYYFHARHYDSGHGRFIGHDLVSPDLNNPLTLNPFLYCLNNPGRWVDPDGRLAVKIDSGFSATLAFYNVGTSQTLLGIDMPSINPSQWSVLNLKNTKVNFSAGMTPLTITGTSNDWSLSIGRSSAPKNPVTTLGLSVGFSKHASIGGNLSYSERFPYLESVAGTLSYGMGLGTPGIQFFGGKSQDLKFGMLDLNFFSGSGFSLPSPMNEPLFNGGMNIGTDNLFMDTKSEFSFGEYP